MKNALELAEEHCIKTEGFVSKVSTGHFFAGYDAAENRIINLIKEEVATIEAQRSTTPGLGNILYALKNVLNKIQS